MKKFLLGLIIFVGVGGMIACGKEVKPSDISKISYGMSQEKVEKNLGKPDVKTTDREELSTKYDSVTMLYAVGIEFDENEEDKNRGYSEYSETFNAIKDKNNVELYVYDTKKDTEKIYVYFIDEKVSFFYVYDYGAEE